MARYIGFCLPHLELLHMVSQLTAGYQRFDSIGMKGI